MRQAIHILKKDLRRLWPQLAVYLVLLLIETVLLLRDPLEPLPRPVDFVPVLALLRKLIMILLAAVVIQQESLVGTTAYWLGRPIRRVSLLTAKSIFLFGCLALPAAFSQAFAAAHFGFPFPSAFAGALLANLAWAFPAAALGAVTSSLVSFSTTAITIGAAYIALFYLLPGGPATSLAQIWAVVASFAVLIYQYRSRDRLTSATIAAAALLVSLTIFHLPLSGGSAPGHFDDSPIRLTATLKAIGRRHSDAGGEARLLAVLTLSGGRPGYVYNVEDLQSTLRDPAGVLSGVHRFEASIGTNVPPEVSDYTHLGTLSDINHWSRMVPLAEFATVKELGDATASLDGIAKLTVYRQVVVARLPLAEGARSQDGQWTSMVRSVVFGRTRLSVVVHTHEFREDGGASPHPTVFLTNPDRHELIGPADDHSSSSSYMHLNGGLQVVVSREEISFELAYYKQRFGIDRDWIENAEILFVQSKPVARFERKITTKPVRLRDLFEPEAAP